MRPSGTAPESDRIPIITRRGRRLAVRLVTATDTPLLAEFLGCLTEDTLRRRFFRPLTSEEAIRVEAARAAGGDRRLRAALVATAVEDGAERAVALAEVAHDADNAAVAEFAIVVRDDYQHEGVGRMLAQVATEVALLRNVGTLRASMLSDNIAIQRLVRGLGLPFTSRLGWGEVTTLLRLIPE